MSHNDERDPVTDRSCHVRFQTPILYGDLEMYYQLIDDLLTRKVNDSWVHDAQSFLEFRVSRLLEEIETLKKALGHDR